MGRTYLTGPPKWRCENCGRFNTMRNRPSPGHSVRKRCEGCDQYQEVSRSKKDYGKIALITAVLVAIGAIGPSILILPIAIVTIWLGYVILNHIVTHPKILELLTKYMSNYEGKVTSIPKNIYENFSLSNFVITAIVSPIILAVCVLTTGFLIALIRLMTGYLTSDYWSQIINSLYSTLFEFFIPIIILITIAHISLAISEDKELLKQYNEDVVSRYWVIIATFILLSLGTYCVYYVLNRNAMFDIK